MLVVFDAYGTLWDVDQIARAIEREVGEQKAPEILALWRQKQLDYAFWETVMGRFEPFSEITRRALRYTLAAHQVDLPPVAIERLMEAWNAPVAFDDAKVALEQLQGFTRVILSNGDRAMLASGVAHSNLKGLLDTALSVEPARCYKPHPAAYQLVLDQYGVSANEVWFVSSNGWDAAGASSFGFRSIWVNRRGLPQERTIAEPDYQVGNLMEAAALMTRASFQQPDGIE